MKTQNNLKTPYMEQNQGSKLERFPIRVLADKTRVGTSTLRAWERRYGLLRPERTPKGHRLYSHADTKRVFKILDLLNDGHSLQSIAELLLVKKEQPDIPKLSDFTEAQDLSVKSTIWDDFLDTTLEAVRDFSIERIDAVYNEASSLYPVDLVTDRLIQPTLTVLGDVWKERPDQGIAEEHFYTSWLKNRLGARFHHAYTNARGARIICACVPGSYHEIGLMLFALSALARGYRVLYFGADMPLNQIGHISQRSAARAVVLGAHIQMDKNINAELAGLVPKLEIPVFIGGSHEFLDTDAFQAAGGILLGSKISVALRVFESHVPPYTLAKDLTGKRQ
ncbi:MAG: MerR family transcriptional regulator [Gammaproteobacteria bacterium]|nr:MAG: MerR family transcriptional regulator [Gammaproteobacteria bacterium]